MNHSSCLNRAAMGALLSTAFLIGGCASTSPIQDAHFGESVRQLNAQQRINPEASAANEAKPLGADGRTVRASSERLLESYRNPQTSEIPTVSGVGGSTGTNSNR